MNHPGTKLASLVAVLVYLLSAVVSAQPVSVDRSGPADAGPSGPESESESESDDRAGPADAGTSATESESESESDDRADDRAGPADAGTSATESESEPGDGEVDLADPLGPIEAALDELQASGFSITQRRRAQSALEGEVLTAIISGGDTDLLVYVLERVAADGYQILLGPRAPGSLEMVALRSRAGQGRGVDFIRIDKLSIAGNFRQGETPDTLRRYAALPPGGIVPTEVAGDFRAIGYRATFDPVAAGELVIRVEPGRAIRRVRVRGHVPLSERNVRRILSVQARPGALARGTCLDRKTLRKTKPASVCSPDDLACQQWERDEKERVERYLFDQGYLKGRARFGLRCGQPGQADLVVYLVKGPAYRASDIKVIGNASSADQRWIKRMFKPRVGPVLPIPKRITRKHIDEAKDRVEREYAEPKVGPGSGARRQLELPYPGVRVDTNFDRLEPENLPPKGRRFTLEVDVQLGNGVPTRFLGNDRVTENRLRKQLQLFKRREPATPVSAAREAENLRNYYQARGHMFAEVEGKYQDFGTLKQLTFVIDEGPRVRVRSVDFEPPASVPETVMRDIRAEYRRQRKISSRGRFTDADASGDLGTLLAAFAERGYLCARAQMRIAPWPEAFDQPGANAVIDPLTALEADGQPKWLENQLDPAGLEALRKEARAGVYARIEIDPGPRVLTSGREAVNHLEIRIPPSREVEGLPVAGAGDWGAPRMLRDGSLRRRNDERSGGIPLKLALDREVEREVSTLYRNNGYPLADAEVRWVYTDAGGTAHRVAQVERLTDPKVGLCRDHATATATTVDTELYVYEGRSGTFGTTIIRGNFKTRKYVLRREVSWKEGDPYQRSEIDVTRRHVEGTGVVEQAQIRERTTDCDLGDAPERPCKVHEVVTVTESKDRLMDLSWGFGAATLDPLYGFIRPTFPNLWGTAWDLQLDGHYGLNLEGLDTNICEGEACYERSGRASLLRQRIFASPLSFEISGQFQRRLTPARGQIDSGLGQVRFTLPISENLRFYFGYLIQFANISKDLVKPTLGSDLGCGVDGGTSCRPPNRGEAIVPDRTGALQTGVTWQKVDNAFNPEEGFIANLDFLFASSYFGGRDWWFRTELDWQHFIPIPKTNDRLNFRYFIRYGHGVPLPGLAGSGANSLPEVWRFFGGGTADLGVRGIEPQTLLVDIEEIEQPYGARTLRPTAQGGHIRALATVALQFVTVRNFLGGKLAHSLFVDLGILTQRWRHVQAIRDIRRSVGINFIKWDIRIVTVSLGYAVLIPNSIIPRNVRPTDDQNGRFVFDVGATF